MAFHSNYYGFYDSKSVCFDVALGFQRNIRIDGWEQLVFRWNVVGGWISKAMCRAAAIFSFVIYKLRCASISRIERAAACMHVLPEKPICLFKIRYIFLSVVLERNNLAIKECIIALFERNCFQFTNKNWRIQVAMGCSTAQVIRVFSAQMDGKKI